MNTFCDFEHGAWEDAEVRSWHKRTSMLTLSMSAFRGKADIPTSLANVR